ncbi:DNA alkylation repair protein [Pseudolysinimonas sp.]|uniref:DNA alkylation repair protein n=1 Tax=Pseudolysinimonas sp. TaxID=2680009 RepID=UPI003783387D
METSPTAQSVRAALAEVANPADAAQLQRYFKTGPGEYGEGDVFLGVRVPAVRAIVTRFRGLPVDEIDALLDDEVHEHRLAGLLLLVAAAPKQPELVAERYLAAVRRGRVDNWDLVDLSAPEALGEALVDGDRGVLDDLAASPVLWERRVAVLATFAFIRRGDASTTLALAARLLQDREDLMHKAVGWMLREVGKRVSRDALLGFLDAHAARMPRTMLSYATEHLTPEQRVAYRALR